MEQTNQGVEPFSISLHNKYKKWFAVQKKLNFFDVRHVTLILIIFFQQNQVYMSYCLHLFVVTFTNFFTKNIFIKLLSNYLSNIFMPILECSSLQLYVTSHLEWPSDQLSLLEHVYMRPEVNSNQFEISNHCERLFLLHGKFTTVKLQISNLFQIFFHLHGDFTATTFQTTVRF